MNRKIIIDKIDFLRVLYMASNDRIETEIIAAKIDMLETILEAFPIE